MPGVKTLLAKELYINDKKEGNSYYYYETGELKESVYYSNGKKQGKAREFDKDSTVITLLQYNNNYLVSREKINRKDSSGKKQGTYKVFHEDGSLKREENYMDDDLHGYFREFDETGELLQAMRYERGAIIEEIDEEAREIIDFKRTYDEQGRIVFSGAYFEGIPRGIHRFFDTTGNIINAYIYNEKGQRLSEGIVDEQGKRVGKWTDYYVSGETKAIGTYRDNKKNGNWIYYFENKSIEQKGSFIGGRFNGEWTWYYPDGEIWRQESFFNGNEDGYSVEYDREQNIISEGVYIDGEKDGDWTHNVGDHKEEGGYIIGLREGKWTYYYGDGSVQFVGNYLQGNPDGSQLYYYPNGALKEEQFYKKGIREKIWRKYDEEGNVTLAITYKNNLEHRINGVKINLPESEIKLIE
ncbi:toxin-antitoxin system YwqK family antitoxin [Bacteroidota bacterium]